MSRSHSFTTNLLFFQKIGAGGAFFIFKVAAAAENGRRHFRLPI
jgi:hypothetical protein